MFPRRTVKLPPIHKKPSSSPQQQQQRPQVPPGGDAEDVPNPVATTATTTKVATTTTTSSKRTLQQQQQRGNSAGAGAGGDEKNAGTPANKSPAKPGVVRESTTPPKKPTKRVLTATAGVKEGDAVSAAADDADNDDGEEGNGEGDDEIEYEDPFEDEYEEEDQVNQEEEEEEEEGEEEEEDPEVEGAAEDENESAEAAAETTPTKGKGARKMKLEEVTAAIEPEEDAEDEDDEGGEDDDGADEDEDGSGEDDDEEEALNVFRPDTYNLEKGEVLEPDNSAYTMLHQMTTYWPCLSMDFLPDVVGATRHWPHTMYVAAGTQATQASENSLMLLKISKLHKTNRDDLESDEDLPGESSEDEEDRDEDVDEDAVLEQKDIKHIGAINRLKCMKQQPSTIATWSETKQVHIWTLRDQLNALDDPRYTTAANPIPLQTLNHKAEGFAMDWSPISKGWFLTGDCLHNIYCWKPAEPAWIGEGPYSVHKSSVEDLQWSPTESTVFASCSSDQTIRIWDHRTKKQPQLTVKAHSCDVNVISWNKLVPHLMVSGADDGTFNIWDLRTFSSGTPISQFIYHTKQITSVEWSPWEDSVLAVAGADDQVTIWDLSLEDDPEEQIAKRKTPADPVPPQLTFVHMGVRDVKEVHWHPQIKNTLGCNSLSGLQFFLPANL
ncbi:WD repeat protein Rrb1 [Pelomyxa schiedti]|nr:WD repeat protein Rrb1 [Pelomyxa schiedti]